MTAGAVTIRTAYRGDASAICRQVRAAFRPEIRDAMIYSAPGAAAWVRTQVDLGALAERTYAVAIARGRVVGAIDVRRTRDALFLAYIVVDGAVQGRGIAARLLGEAVAGASTHHRTFALDVFADNIGPRAWYRRLGLLEVGESAWWSVDLAANPSRAARLDAVVVSNFAAASATHRAYGFSEFGVMTPDGDYTVGRIDRGWFRVANPTAADDDSLLAALRHLDPSRRLLVIAPSTSAPRGADDAPISVSVRMQGPLADVRARLADRGSRPPRPCVLAGTVG